MPSISKAFIRRLIDTVSIEDVIGRRIKLIKKGREYQALCPFHGEKTPSFTVSPQKQFYYCFGCHVSGNSLDFLKNYEKLDFIEAVESLAGIAGLLIEYDENDNKPLNISKHDYTRIYEKLAMAYHSRLMQNTQVMDYANKRNIHKAAIDKFYIGYAPNSLNAQFNYLKRFYDVSNLSHIVHQVILILWL